MARDRRLRDQFDPVIEQHPGASYDIVMSSRHFKVTIRLGGRSKFIIVSNTPSDGARTAKNNIALFRRTIRELTQQEN